MSGGESKYKISLTVFNTALKIVKMLAINRDIKN